MRSIGENPFADVGTVIAGDRFIGRGEEIRRIRDRVLGGGGYGSVAVTGMPRIGKSSLIRQSLMFDDRSLAQRKIVVVTLDVGEFKSPAGMFSSIVSRSLEGIREGGLSGMRLEELAATVSASDDDELFNGVRKFFRECRLMGVRTICVLEEFDVGRYLFSQNARFFHWLRELASNPDFKVGLVLVAKRQLAEISGLAGHESSYWANVLLTMKIVNFSQSEVDEVLDRFTEVGILRDREERAHVEGLCGHHPYLLDLLGFYAYEQMSVAGRLDFGDLRKRLLPHYREVFSQIIEVLSDGPLLSKLIQVLVGPRFDLSQSDVEVLLQLGVVYRDDDEGLCPFSPVFLDYLNMVSKTVDVWPLWRDTERTLREALGQRLVEVLDVDWASALQKKRPGLQIILDRCREGMKRESEKFGFQASDNLLDYTYPQEIFQIMSSDWSNLGLPLLGGTRSQWAGKFEVLAQVRNPLAHNRVVAVEGFLVQQAEGLCREILARLDNWNLSVSGEVIRRSGK